jgi:cytochrome c oxidase subunit 2
VPFRQVFGQVFGLEVTIAAVVFALVALVVVAAVLASWFRRRRGRPPWQRAEHNRLEGGYALALAGIAVFLIVVSFSSNAREMPDPPSPAVRVIVTAFQWCWQFHYAGQPVTVRGQCAGGPLPTLVLPAGEPVRLELTSRDVIHGFWVPALRWKMDVFPQHVNSFTITLPRPGRWIGRCSEFCGLYHYGMDFYVRALPPAQFSQWLKARGGSPVTGRAQ